MSRGRRLAAAGGVAAAVAIGLIAWTLLDDSDDTAAVMTEFAGVESPEPTFPAIADSAVRDPAERVAPVAATFEIVAVVDHDPAAFTQGLEFDGDRLFESTGLVGASTLREVDPGTGQVLRSRAVPDVFAEGMTVVDDEIVQLTWTDEIAYRYDRDTFELITTHTYEGQGWGLCDDGSRLVMSDGSSELTFRDRTSFAATGSVQVTFNGAPVERLNELECVDGLVWANVWKTPLLIEIDPDDGRVVTVVDASSLRPQSTVDDTSAVMNGIAHDPATDTLFVTGKLWPSGYVVRIDRP